MRDRVKVIVMEDAERLLWRRNGDNREAVSSLLNIADGLMGRMLRLHVICSVNARMEDLDPAVLRPGRLMNHRRFDALSRERRNASPPIAVWSSSPTTSRKLHAGRGAESRLSEAGGV